MFSRQSRLILCTRRIYPVLSFFPNLVLGMLVAFCVAWHVAADVPPVELQSHVEDVLEQEGLVGIAWALLEEEGVQVGAAGLRDSALGTAFTVDTRFHVGSVTKAVLATGMLRLATQGRLDLDAPIVDYLPALAGVISRDFDKVTSRQLLDHTAGLNDAYLWQMFSQRAHPDDPLVDAFSNPQEQLALRSAPGSQFNYSNMGYTLAGMVIESVTGERYEEYLDASLLAPLGMDHSTFAFTAQEDVSADSSLAWGHIDDGARYGAQPVFLRPAAQMTTSAGDLAVFAAFLLSDGRVGGEPFIDASLMRARGKVTGTHAAQHGLLAGYALGLGRRDRHGVVGYCHGGNTVGFKAMLCVFPEERRAFVYSVNTDSEVADYGRLDALFIDALEISSAKSTLDRAVAANSQSDLEQWRGWYVYSPNRFHSFRYLDALFGAIQVVPTRAALTLYYLQRSDRELTPTRRNRFVSDDRSTESHVFFKDSSGAAFLSDGFQTYQRVSWSFLAVRWLSLVLGLLGMLWTLVYGAAQLVRYGGRFFGLPIAPAFVASLLLFAPIPLFFTQSFMALGDLTLASAALAFVTALMPIAFLATILRCLLRRETAAWISAGVPAACVLQWCAVLASYSLLPLRLWA